MLGRNNWLYGEVANLALYDTALDSEVIRQFARDPFKTPHANDAHLVAGTGPPCGTPLCLSDTISRVIVSSQTPENSRKVWGCWS